MNIQHYILHQPATLLQLKVLSGHFPKHVFMYHLQIGEILDPLGLNETTQIFYKTNYFPFPLNSKNPLWISHQTWIIVLSRRTCALCCLKDALLSSKAVLRCFLAQWGGWAESKGCLCFCRSFIDSL